MAVQAGLPSFYIYSGEVYDQTGLLECWPSWPYEDQAAEVRMLMQLWLHPQRVLSPESAELFVVPVLPYISLLTGECLGRTHEARMSLVADALQHSQYFMRSGGRDHLVVSNTFRTVAFRALKPLLVNATFGWFEDPAVPRGGPNTLYRQAFWRCTVVVPYQANPFCMQQRALRNVASGRTTSVFFQGSWEAAPRLRRYFAGLSAIPRASVLDVSRASLSLASPWHRRNASSSGAGEEWRESMARFSKLGTARGMLASEFCLIPKGDTPTSSRFFTAIACGCAPIVLSDQIKPHLPFTHAARYERFVTYVPERTFASDPVGSLLNVTAALRPHLTEIQSAMDASAAEVLLETQGSRVGTNLLSEWRSRCARGERRVDGNSAQAEGTAGVGGGQPRQASTDPRPRTKPHRRVVEFPVSVSSAARAEE